MEVADPKIKLRYPEMHMLLLPVGLCFLPHFILTLQTCVIITACLWVWDQEGKKSWWWLFVRTKRLLVSLSTVLYPSRLCMVTLVAKWPLPAWSGWGVWRTQKWIGRVHRSHCEFPINASSVWPNYQFLRHVNIFETKSSICSFSLNCSHSCFCFWFQRRNTYFWLTAKHNHFLYSWNRQNCFVDMEIIAFDWLLGGPRSTQTRPSLFLSWDTFSPHQ